MKSVRSLALAFGIYFVLYLSYLAWWPESELLHWLTLVAMPLTLLRILLRRPSGLPSLREALRAAGFSGRPRARGIVAALLVGVLLSGLQLAGRNANEIQDLILSPRVLWLWPLSFFMMLLTAATTEEFFFRGILLKRCSAATGSKWLSVGITSILFALYHVPYAYHLAAWGTQFDLSGALRSAFETGFPLGILLGSVFVIAGENTLASILAHALINSLPGMLIVQSFFGS